MAQDTNLAQTKAGIFSDEAKIRALQAKISEQEKLCKEKDGMALIECEMHTAALELELMNLREQCALLRISADGVIKDLQYRKQNKRNLVQLISTVRTIIIINTWAIPP